MLRVYNEIVAVKRRGQAPAAGASWEQAKLGNCRQAARCNQLAALVCFSCGRACFYFEEFARKVGPCLPVLPICASCLSAATRRWLSLFHSPRQKIEERLGLQLYFPRCGVAEPARQKKQFTILKGFIAIGAAGCRVCWIACPPAAPEGGLIAIAAVERSWLRFFLSASD